MTERKRNVLVGATVLVAVIILGGMILIFQELPAFMRPGYQVKFTSYNTGGLRIGSDVTMVGLRIGRISEIEIAAGNAREGVTIIATIDRKIDIPGDINAYISHGGFSSGASLRLSPDDGPPGSERIDPVTEGPLAWIPRSRVETIVITREKGGDSGILPEGMVSDIREAMVGFKSLAGTLNAFFAPPPATTTAPTATTATSAPALPKPPAPPNFHTTLAKLDAALEAINKNLGDEENQANFKAALANFNIAATAATEAMEDLGSMAGDISSATKSASKRFDDLMGHLTNDADRLGKVLTSLHRTAVKIEKGTGTAGKIINDPALYENLINTTKQLQSTLDTLQKLLEKWKTEGVKMKLAG